MAADIPSNEPLEFVAGDTVKWYKSLADYTPQDGWTLKYRIVGGTIDLTKTADASSGTWLTTIDAADTAAIVADTTCRMIGWVEQGTEKWTVFDDYVRVKPNLRTATATNLKTHEVRTLEAIESVIEGRATADLEQYQVNGRAVTKIPMTELFQLRGMYRAIVWRQQNPGASFPSHAVRFSSARG